MKLQNKSQLVTIRAATKTPMTIDGKSENFKIFADVFNRMIKMQPVMTEQMKNNHFQSLLKEGALQTFRNLNSMKSTDTGRRLGYILPKTCQMRISSHSKIQVAKTHARSQHHERT